MLKELGIVKLSKYHIYRNELNYLNNFINEYLNKYGDINNFPPTIQNRIKKERSRIERYAIENSIKEISEEILLR